MAEENQQAEVGDEIVRDQNAHTTQNETVSEEGTQAQPSDTADITSQETDSDPSSDTPTGETVADEVESADDSVEEAGAEEADTEETVAEAAVDPADLEFSDDDIVDDDYDLTEEADDESASPIEEFVEEVVEVEDEIKMDWYILKVQVNREKGICENLLRQVKKAGMEHYFGEVLVPTEDVREFKKDGKQKITKRKLYPGYVVVNMAINDDSWFLVRETSGIGDFAGAAGRPAPLTQPEIERILQAARPEEQGEEETIKTAIPFKIGERVRIKEGYFQNYEGDISNIDERNGRIEVMIDIFGRPNPVDMDHWHAEKVT